MLADTFSLNWENISATPAPFKLDRGLYKLIVRAETWGGGGVTLQRRSADGSIFRTAFNAFTGDGSATAYVPSGAYQLTIETATNVTVDLVLIETL